jgi:hypothetical protein
MQDGFFGTQYHQSIANWPTVFAYRETDRSLDLDISRQMNVGWVGSSVHNIGCRNGNRARVPHYRNHKELPPLCRVFLGDSGKNARSADQREQQCKATHREINLAAMTFQPSGRFPQSSQWRAICVIQDKGPEKLADAFNPNSCKSALLGVLPNRPNSFPANLLRDRRVDLLRVDLQISNRLCRFFRVELAIARQLR